MCTGDEKKGRKDAGGGGLKKQTEEKENAELEVEIKEQDYTDRAVGALAALIYQVLGAFGIAPGISEDTVLEIAGLAVNALCLLGIVVDPTTQGVADSDRALGYDDLGGDESEGE